MRIAIDASAAAREKKTGVGQYVWWLLRCLADLDRENTYFVCHRLSRFRDRRHFVRIPRPNFRNKIIQEPFHPLFMRRLDLFHGPDARLPLSRGVKTVVTCHDVVSLVTDEFANEKFRRKKVERYREIADRATRIIAVSESTKREMVERLGADPARITVVLQGISDDFHPRPAAEQEAVRAKFSLQGDYVLYVGALSSRKNVRGLIEAFGAVAKASDVSLVLAGRPGYGADRELAPIEALGLRDRVRRLGYVADEDLPPLYSAARLLLFPSLYEGFGIPVLEAMACGTPVVTSDCSSLPEVAGGAALLVDPRDPEAIAEAALRVLGDEALRHTLRAKGLERGRLFPWTRTARETLQVYREVGGA